MGKLVGVLIIIILILSFGSGFLVYQLNNVQNMNSELRNQNNELLNENSELQTRISELEDLLNKVTNRVNITEFSISGMKPHEGFVVWESDVHVKIHNLGINDIEGLTLIIVGFGDESLAETLQIDPLHVGEEKEIYTHAYWVYGSYGTSVATLKLGDTTLDEHFVPFSAVY